MKVGIFLTGHTKPFFALLERELRHKAILNVFVSKEELPESELDIFITDSSDGKRIAVLLALEKPPLILIPGEGRSGGNLRYLPDFSAQFPEILEDFEARTPTLVVSIGHQKYLYHQSDIVFVRQDVMLTIFLRSGKTVISADRQPKIFKQLSPVYFFKVNPDFYINADYLTRFDGKELRLQNGLHFPVPPEHCKKVENAIFKTKYHKTQALFR